MYVCMYVWYAIRARSVHPAQRPPPVEHLRDGDRRPQQQPPGDQVLQLLQRKPEETQHLQLARTGSRRRALAHAPPACPDPSPHTYKPCSLYLPVCLSVCVCVCVLAERHCERRGAPGAVAGDAVGQVVAAGHQGGAHAAVLPARDRRARGAGLYCDVMRCYNRSIICITVYLSIR